MSGSCTVQTAEHMHKCTEAGIIVPSLVCATHFDENAIPQSFLLGSKMSEKKMQK